MKVKQFMPELYRKFNPDDEIIAQRIVGRVFNDAGIPEEKFRIIGMRREDGEFVIEIEEIDDEEAEE